MIDSLKRKRRANEGIVTSAERPGRMTLRITLKSGKLREGLQTLALGLFLAFAVVAIYKTTSWEVEQRQRGWEKKWLDRRGETTGEITSVVEDTDLRSLEDGCAVPEKGVRVDFNYQANGRAFAGSNFAFGHTPETIKLKRPPRVCYNPDNPEDAVLRMAADNGPCGGVPTQ